MSTIITMGSYKPARDIEVGQRKAMLVKSIEDFGKCDPTTHVRLVVTDEFGFNHHIIYQRGWKRFLQRDLLVLEMTDKPCVCPDNRTNHDSKDHRMWKFVKD